MGSKKNRSRKAAKATRLREAETVRIELMKELGPEGYAQLRAADVLKAQPSLSSIIQLAEETTQTKEEFDEIVLSTTFSKPFACKEGCSWCCYLRVDLTTPELFRITDYLQTKLTDAEREALRERIRTVDETTRGLSPDDRFSTSLPSPLLVDARCSVYPVRPISCRGMHSFDASMCEAGYNDPRSLPVVPQHAYLRDIAPAINRGMSRGLNDAEVDGSMLELTAALRIAFEIPDAQQRWIAGESVFLPARA